MDVSQLQTFVYNGSRIPLEAADRALLHKASENPDMYLPYRYHAPSAQRLRELFHGQGTEVLRTDLGLKNLVITRYMSYNAPFLLSGEQKFANSLDDLLRSISMQPLRPPRYFLNPRIYGQNRFRFVDRVPAVWEGSRWPVQLGRDFITMWRTLAFGINKTDKTYKIPNIGNLLSLQICGTCCPVPS